MLYTLDRLELEAYIFKIFHVSMIPTIGENSKKSMR